ncbi:hypothetical protein IJ076_01175 [Candidatus Saccharibacteria bacterium]|nr:hypothetical protein [Candidatus Saccharibacteria bacterium]
MTHGSSVHDIYKSGMQRSINERPKTLVVQEIHNLTKQMMWCYGTSGALIKLAPEPFDGNLSDLPSETGVYYVVDKKTEKKFESSNTCSHLAHSYFSGIGYGGVGIFHFTISGANGEIPIAPISEKTGIIGSSIW